MIPGELPSTTNAVMPPFRPSSVVLIGGVGLAVQTFVAQAEGGRRSRGRPRHLGRALAERADPAVFRVARVVGCRVVRAFGLAPDVSQQAMAFWQPRMLGAPLAIALWALLGFFNGISRPRIAVMTTGLVAIVNALLNWLFIFELDGASRVRPGPRTSAWCAGPVALRVFLGPELRSEYNAPTWRPDLRNLMRQYRLGLPMGAMYAADLFGMALFQLMQVRLSAAEGAATQIIMMLTSMSYMPGIGIALAGTTLVGQSIGAATATGRAGSATHHRADRRIHGHAGVLLALRVRGCCRPS